MIDFAETFPKVFFYNEADRKSGERLINSFIEIAKCASPIDSSLPPRGTINTYLPKLNAVFRGGWSWHWPLVIAGPRGSGKTQLIYQLMASTLYTFPKPWRIWYWHSRPDLAPHRLQKMLEYRVPKYRSPAQLGRFEAIFYTFSMLTRLLMILSEDQTNLGLWVIDEWISEGNYAYWEYWLNGFSIVAQKKQLGLIISLEMPLEKALSILHTTNFPYLLYLTPLKIKNRKKRFRLRMYNNSPSHKVYDRQLELGPLFRERKMQVSPQTKTSVNGG